MAQIRRTRRGGRRTDLLRELPDQPERSLVRARSRAGESIDHIPSLIENHVEEQFDRLESKIIGDFRQIGQQVIEKSTAVITNQLADRIDTLEKISTMQREALVKLQRTSSVTEARVHSAVDSIGYTLSGAGPGGFRLEQTANVLHAVPSANEAVKFINPENAEVEEAAGKIGYCPKCTSINVRRATRSGFFEQFLRLFFIAPFRCRACRHKFYRF